MTEASPAPSAEAHTQIQGSDALLAQMIDLHPKAMDLALDRMWPLLEKLGQPHQNLPPVIHVAGTNGKGSTQAMIRAGLEQAGKAVHAYTSPHLVRFHERIRLAGDLISEAALVETLQDTLTANDGNPITFFEITTCAAMAAFMRTPADYTLLEVGLGGRFDTTNIISGSEICVITPISMDHQQFLGDTLAKIAWSKAGIIKKDTPCVVTRQPDEVMEVIETEAALRDAPLLIQGRQWDVWEERGRLVYQDENGLLDLPKPRLLGAHQFTNAGAAIAVLRHLGFDEAACEAAVTNVEWQARMQRLKTGPLVDMTQGQAELWLDGGHNEAAGRAIADLLAGLPKCPTYLICGMLQTKDVRGYLEPLVQMVDGLSAVSIPGETATLPAEDTAEAANAVGMQSVVSDSPEAALAAILQKEPNARVLICGSLYLAGVILSQNA